MADLFIPKRIRVGYQKRPDTYTQKLAYVIYYDAKGKLRKETSWEGWRHKDIEPEEFDNTPHGGFILNKGHTRYSWSHYNSNRRTVIRIYDDRGIEFEITPENLVGLLMETTCAKRGLEGDFVYAWNGTDLVLLPCCSEEYQKAKVFTDRQDMKVSAKDMKPGCSYTTKKGEEVIYIGRYNWFEWNSYTSGKQISKKAHIFAHPTKPQYGNKFYPKDNVSFVAYQNSADPVTNYAELVDEFNGTVNSSVIKSWEATKLKDVNVDTDPAPTGNYNNFPTLKKGHYVKLTDDKIHFYVVDAVYGNDYNFKAKKNEANLKGYYWRKRGELDLKTLMKTGEENYSSYYHGYYSYSSYDRHQNLINERQVLAKIADMDNIDLILESGKKLNITDFSELH